MLLLSVFLLALFGWSMHRGLNHDEHQFLAPGALLANEGPLPFRDYPIFHLPNLTFVYAALDQLTERPIFSAKLFSVACSWVTGLLLVLTASRFPPFGEKRYALPAAFMALGFLFFDPLFTFTSGKTWNHEFPTCLAIAATVIAVENMSRASVKLAAIAGLCIGCAVGTRLTFAPILIPLGAAQLLIHTNPRRRLFLGLSFAIGALLALLPTFLLYRAAPEAFLFDNLQFPRLRLLDTGNERIQKTMVWWRKLRYLAKEVVLPSWPLFTAFILLGIGPAVCAIRQREKSKAAVVLCTIPFVVAGCFAPSRYQYQHYFVVIPFLIVGALYGAATVNRLTPFNRFAIPALFTVSFSLYTNDQIRKKDAEWVANTFRPAEWFPNRAYSMSAELRKAAGPGKILTLAPAWVAEAGLQIYPEFANGPFAWRTAHLLDKEKRARLKLVAAADLEEFLSKDPPGGVLLGFEEDALEKPLREYAIRHGYRRMKPNRKWEFWVPAA